MKHWIFTILFTLLLVFSKAQQLLPTGLSFLAQAAFNRPLDITPKSSDSFDRYKLRFDNSGSISIGLNRVKKSITFSPMVRYSYTSGRFSRTFDHTYGKSTTKGTIALGKITGEVTWYARIGKNKNLALGAGLFAGGNIHKEVKGTEESWDYVSGTYHIHNLSNNSFGNFHNGIILDVKHTLRAQSTANSCLSIGARYLGSSGVFVHSSFKGYREFELYLTYNLWKASKKDTTHKAARKPVERILPKGISFFGQVYINRLVDNPNKSEYGGKALFKPGAGLSLGANFANSKIIFSPYLKYGYVRGHTESRHSYRVSSEELITDFSIIRLSEEFVLLRTIGRNKRFFLGGGAFFGQSIKGRYDGYYKTTSFSTNIISTRKVTKQDFFNWCEGIIVDARYNVKTRVPSGTCFSIGARFTTSTSILPYSKGTYALLEQQGVEIYFSYNLWKKRKPEEPKPVEESKEPVNWNHQNDN